MYYLCIFVIFQIELIFFVGYDLIVSMTERKGSLPYGWQVKTSTRYPDRVYYFNIFTGSSTWECPELDPPREIKAEVCEFILKVTIHCFTLFLLLEVV